MTRYNSEANEAYVGLSEEHIPPEQLEGYREGVDRLMWFLADWDGEGEHEGGLISDIREAIQNGVV